MGEVDVIRVATDAGGFYSAGVDRGGGHGDAATRGPFSPLEHPGSPAAPTVAWSRHHPHGSPTRSRVHIEDDGKTLCGVIVPEPPDERADELWRNGAPVEHELCAVCRSLEAAR